MTMMTITVMILVIIILNHGNYIDVNDENDSMRTQLLWQKD